MSEDLSTTRLSGPMVVVTWLVALGWVVLAIVSWVGLPAPGGIILAAVGSVAALLTGWLAATMVVSHDAEGVELPKLGRTEWADVQAIELHEGLVSVPYVVVRQGRTLTDVPLDGLAWFGGTDGLARTLAEKLAAAAGIDAVGVRSKHAAPGRRAA
ncbi:MAG: hypothetical protein Q4F65_01235 [Propionibacteriaceae bacterium]|nr:hypothetical protein [Propionibacteriaceae bacterium]